MSRSGRKVQERCPRCGYLPAEQVLQQFMDDTMDYKPTWRDRIYILKNWKYVYRALMFYITVQLSYMLDEPGGKKDERRGHALLRSVRDNGG